MTYISGLKDLISIKQKYPGLEMILHTDQGSVYASKDFNEPVSYTHLTLPTTPYV